MDKYDVFISFNNKDSKYADEIFKYLVSKGISVFYSKESLPRIGQAEYHPKIHEAIEGSTHMIVVTSSKKNVESKWVTREWTLFDNEKLAERKSGNIVTVIAGDMVIAELPLTLRNYEVMKYCEETFEKILKYMSVEKKEEPRKCLEKKYFPDSADPIMTSENEIQPVFKKEKDLTLQLGGGVKLEMVWIPAGIFKMGSRCEEIDRREREDPIHSVNISRDFYIGKYTVTQGQWKQIMGGNPSKSSKGDDYPVENVSWEDCQEFIDKLNKMSLLRNIHSMTQFKMPTEAQWEYACRAGTQTRFYWGDDPSYTFIDDYAWCEKNSGSATHPVGLKNPNSFGLYDMSGNVWEWCQDWYESDYYRTLVDGAKDPSGPESGSNRVIRGGSWNYRLRSCRSAARYSSRPSRRSGGLGFRLVILSV